MRDEDRRAYYEAIDDVEAGALGRSRMADGRRIELSVEGLACLIGVNSALGDGVPGEAGRD